jgi:predicted nucleic acid-binding protein
MAGRAKFLVTNDRDLLEIDQSEKRKFRFEIITPAKFLSWLRVEKLNP